MGSSFLQNDSTLALAELETLARASHAVLLAFLDAGIAREQAGLLQARAQLDVVFAEGARDAEPERARLAGFPNASNQDKAYLLGFQLGTLRKKHDWEARVYWQRTGQYALDPNLVDSDWFDSRINLQGWVLAAGYNITDSIFTAARYGWAKRYDTGLGTGGVGDLALNPMDDYQLFQLDLGWRF